VGGSKTREERANGESFNNILEREEVSDQAEPVMCSMYKFLLRESLLCFIILQGWAEFNRGEEQEFSVQSQLQQPQRCTGLSCCRLSQFTLKHTHTLTTTSCCFFFLPFLDISISKKK